MADKLVIRSYPKTITLILTAIIALIFGGIELIPVLGLVVARALGLVFIIAFFFNLLIISFDFNEARSYGLFALIIIILLVYIILAQQGIIPPDIGSNFIAGLQITLSAQAYFAIALSILFMLFLAWLGARFNYWIIDSNQIERRSGIFGRKERYSTAGMRYVIDIDDLFEYLLFKAGSITFYFPTKKTAMKITMVPNIKKVEEELNKILGRVEVEEETEVSEVSSTGE